MASAYAKFSGEPNYLVIEVPDQCSIFVHAGAGYHSTQNEAQHLKACSNACRAGLAAVMNGGCAMDGVEAAIRSLEDDGITNSGYGSNLTSEGRVECDASIMDWDGMSGAVATVDLVKNPISLARLIRDNSMHPFSLRRVPPNFLAGPGAIRYAMEYNYPTCKNEALVSPTAKSRYMKWRKELEVFERRNKVANGVNMNVTARPKDYVLPTSELHVGVAPLTTATPPDQPSTPTLLNADVDVVSDTVGAICIDKQGRMAAGSSSGGIGMKHPGRIGPAALVGTGTWVRTEDKKMSAVVTSGTGEHMTNTLIARAACDRLWDEDDDILGTKDIIDNLFMGSGSVRNATCPGAIGFLCAKIEDIAPTKRMISFVFGHNTDSMAVASMTAKEKQPRIIMSRSYTMPKLSVGGYSRVLRVPDPVAPAL